jgi:RNA polymerase sigma-70 factor (ECF subfamily)
MSVKGDADSCKKLYDQMIDKIFAYVAYRTNTRECAIDITQDVFIDLFAALSNFTYQSDAQFYAYVFTITRRKLAMSYAQLQKRGENIEFEEQHMTPVDAAKGQALSAAIDIHIALKELDEVAREIVVLHHWSRYTFGEIALLVDMQESTVRVRHHRALKRLAEILHT